MEVLAAPAEASPAQTQRATTWYVTVGTQTSNGAIQGMAFLPSQIWINAGDTVVWTSAAGEPHTVTFLRAGQSRPAFNGSDSSQTKRQGGSTYTGSGYFNSGLLNKGQSYSLRFTTTGDFSYLCLVHSSMWGVVHVRPAGTAYPYSQGSYNAQGRSYGNNLLSSGAAQANFAARASSNTVVTVGIGNGRTSVLRFYPYTANIHVGQTVAFVNWDTMAPHTVTFGANRGNIMAAYGTPSAFNGTSQLNSGYLWYGQAFRVTFTQPGTFNYHCSLHASLGMYGRVVVTR
jgi:plastocyanin